MPPVDPGSYAGAGPGAATVPGTGGVEGEGDAARRSRDLQNAVVDEGSDVVDRDGRKVGEVHHLTFDPDSGRLTRFVVRKGFIFTDDEEHPASLIDRVDDGVIYLKVRTAELPKAESGGKL